MTRYVMLQDTIYDLQNGSLETDHPIDCRHGHVIWSAEAFLDSVERMNHPAFIKPFYFLDVID